MRGGVGEVGGGWGGTEGVGELSLSRTLAGGECVHVNFSGNAVFFHRECNSADPD